MIAARNFTPLLQRSLTKSASTKVVGEPRFTLDGSAELENHLERTCRRVLAAVRSVVPQGKLEAVLLGGGYGRGEGGVLKTNSGDHPYNDLEFYVFLRGNDFLNNRHYHARLHEAAENFAPLAGVDVEFKLLSLAKLRRSQVSMFYYDLVMGHRWLLGEEKLLTGCEHHRQADRIPLAEATRLLMNRCTGLLLVGERLGRASFSTDDADFVRRNVAKAELALGDAVSTVFGQYHWSCRERNRRLAQLLIAEEFHWLPEVFRHHEAGVSFKLHPERSNESKAALQLKHLEIAGLALSIWLWLESRRLHKAFASAVDYALSPLNKCPETNRLKNAALNLGTFGVSALLDARIGRHPRERVLHALALLLWRSGALGEPVLVSRVQKELRAAVRGLGGALAAYTSLWRRFR